MPDSKGNLSIEEKEKIKKWLESKWKGGLKCPVEAHNQWVIGDAVVCQLNYSGSGTIIGGRVAPQVMLICADCGYTMFFNAMIMGLFTDNGKGDSDA